jgi:hypothetical protein
MSDDSHEVGSRAVSGNSLIITYRSLRMAIVLAVGMIFVSIIYEFMRADYLRGSISAHFYSPTRSVFTGALLVIGFSLVVIHVAHRWEETFLTLGGMLAIIVALVPTKVPWCEQGDTSGGAVQCRLEESDPSYPDWVKTLVENNLLALVVIGVIALILTRMFAPADDSGNSLSQLNFVLWIYAVLLVVGGILYETWDLFARNTHMIAAISTFACVGVTAAMNGWARPESENPKKYRDVYRVVAIGMVAAALLYGIAKLFGGFEDDLFWLEAAELVIFAGYWLAQTSQHWNEKAE